MLHLSVGEFNDERPVIDLDALAGEPWPALSAYVSRSGT
jgi:hypothetical protein